MSATDARHETPAGSQSTAQAAGVDLRAGRKPRRSRRYRFIRAGVIMLACLCATGALGLWIITRSWFIVGRLEPVLSKKLGGEVRIASASYGGSGRLALDDVRVRARDMNGPAAEVAAIGHADVTIDLRSLFTGEPRLESLDLSNITVRVSEDRREPGRMNFMRLRPHQDRDDNRLPRPPRVRIRNLALEVGTHDGADFSLNGSRRMTGEMHPVPGERHWFAYELAEVDAGGRALGDGGLFIKGDWNPLTTEAHGRIESIALDDRVYRMLPQQAQTWWRLMNLEGGVDGVIIDWHPQEPLSVQFNVRDVAMTIPVDLGEMWSLYRDGEVIPTTTKPRMRVHSGMIRVGTHSFMLDEMRGELISADPSANIVPVPYEVSLNVPRLPPRDANNPEHWIEEALKTSAFEMTARLDNFSLSKAEGAAMQAVGLPTIVANVLAKFQTTNWVLATSVRMRRGDAALDDGGIRHAAPLEVTGQAYINDAAGSYHKFPYLMEDVDAYLRFDSERVDVEYLQARGSGGSTFRITGYITPPDKDSELHLEVLGFNVPLDERVRDALKGGERQAIDALFHAESARRLAAAGLLPDEAAIARMTAERERLAERLAQLRRAGPPAEAQSGDLARMQREVDALDRSIRAGPFVAGGTVNVKLCLDRALGPNKPTEISGDIDIRNAGLVFDRFPYPLRGSGGRLKWAPDRVTVDAGDDGRGIRFVTPSGGAGSVTGHVAFPKVDGKRRLQPDLTFTIDDDPANAVICAAIPFTRTELAAEPEAAARWPGLAHSRASRIVEGIGLEGFFDYRGRIFSREDTGKMDWDFSVDLDGGIAAPNVLLAEAIGARDLPWPEGLTLVDLGGSVRVQRSGVSWTDVTGRGAQAGEGATISTSGLIDMRSEGGPDSVSVHMVEAPIHRSSLNMISRDHATEAEYWWDRFQPQGRINGSIVWRSDAPPAESAVFTLWPTEASMLLHDERIGLRTRDGAVRIDRRAVHFDDLAIDLAAQSAPQAGTVGIRGEWAFAGDTPGFSLSGEWLGGRLECPVIPEALRLFKDERQAARYREFQPAGVLDLEFTIDKSRQGEPADYRIGIEPHTLEFTLRDTRVRMDITDGLVSIVPGFLAFERLSGRAADGAFSVDGGVTTVSPIDASLAIDYHGLLRSQQVAAFLPQAVTDALQAIEFQDRAPGMLRNGFLQVRESEAGWQTAFTGRIETPDASFVAGVPFREVDGSFDLDIAHEPGRPLRLNAIGRARSAVVFGQTITDIEAPMSLNAAGDALEIPGARGRSGDGAVAASAIAGIGTRRDYALRIDLVASPLGSMLQPRVAANPAAAAASAPAEPVVEIADREHPAPHRPPPVVATPPGGPDQRRRGRPVTGEVYANITLSGERGDAQSKRGRGVFRVLKGHISSIPLLLQAMQVMQLTMPFTGGLDFADAHMYIVGDIAHFERILFESTVGDSAALQLIGEGTLNLQTMEINARFRPRSGIAILRDIIGGIGDMLYEIEITGPLREPRARIVPLP